MDGIGKGGSSFFVDLFSSTTKNPGKSPSNSNIENEELSERFKEKKMSTEGAVYFPEISNNQSNQMIKPSKKLKRKKVTTIVENLTPKTSVFKYTGNDGKYILGFSNFDTLDSNNIKDLIINGNIELYNLSNVNYSKNDDEITFDISKKNPK